MLAKQSLAVIDVAVSDRKNVLLAKVFIEAFLFINENAEVYNGKLPQHRDTRNYAMMQLYCALFRVNAQAGASWRHQFMQIKRTL